MSPTAEHEEGIELRALPGSLQDAITATSAQNSVTSASPGDDVTFHSSDPGSRLSSIRRGAGPSNRAQIAQVSEAAALTRETETSRAQVTTAATPDNTELTTLQSMLRAITTRGLHPDPICDSVCCCCDRCTGPTLTMAILASAVACGGFFWAWEQDRLERDQDGYRGGVYAPGYDPGDVYDHQRPAVRWEGVGGDGDVAEVGVVSQQPRWQAMTVVDTGGPGSGEQVRKRFGRTERKDDIE